jgi:hypothetical protein
MKRGLLTVLVVGLMVAPASANLLINGDFETGDLTGWNIGPPDISVGAPGIGAHGGQFALRMNQPPPNGGVPEVNQGSFDSGLTIPASPGVTYDLSGYMLTEAALPGAGATNFGLFKIVFEDAAGNDLIPASD